MPALKRELGLLETSMLGIGVIVGAGIYALVGVAGVEAGNALWLAFAIAGVIAFLTALSYAELSSMFPKSGASYYYAKNAFASQKTGFLLGWLIIASYITASATVALGFGQYLHALFPVITQVAAALILLAVVGAINVLGVKQASGVNLFCGFLEVAGLLAVIVLALLFAFPNAGFQTPKGIDGLVTASMLAFFAFLGFEVLATSAEEVKNVKKTLPKAILLAITATTILYVTVSIAFTSLMPYREIVSVVQQGAGALAVAAGKAGGALSLSVLAIIALFSTSNTVLISVFGTSRMLYGMAKDAVLPKFLSNLNTHKTPANAVYSATVMSMLLALLGDIKLVAEATVIGMFLVFLVDNAAVIALRLKQPNAERGFRIPLSVKNVPLPTLAAIASILAILVKASIQNPVLGVIAFCIVIAGLLAYEGEKKVPRTKIKNKSN